MTDIKRPATTTEDSHGLKNDTGRRDRGLVHQRVIDNASHDMKSHLQHTTSHSSTALNDNVRSHHMNAAITQTTDQPGIVVIGLTGNGLVRSLVPSTGLDHHRGMLISRRSCLICHVIFPHSFACFGNYFWCFMYAPLRSGLGQATVFCHQAV